jgi:large exoprotein involved in heme utilization and adhesion
MPDSILGGSFVGTTANSIKFADGTEFSPLNPSSPPLLRMSVPIGLQMGQNAAQIQV